MMADLKPVFVCQSTRTPIGRYGGALAKVRPDDLAAHVIKAVTGRIPGLDLEAIDEVTLGCANQAGEDNRNVARMAGLLAGLPDSVPASTINRLCGSGMEAVGLGARAIACGEADMVIAGGVESMSRAPFVMPKSETSYGRTAEIFDTTIGWRFINPLIKAQYGIDSMPETAENVAEDYDISRADQDAFALRSQERAAAAQASGRLAEEITPISIPQRKGDPLLIDTDEHPRVTTLEKLGQLPTPFRAGGSVTAGNASGVNDGAAALILASEEAATRNGLDPVARVLGMTTAGVPPRVMGIGPLPASERLLTRLGLAVDNMDTIELNEAFAAQALAVTRGLGLADNDPKINPNGGAIALGHPLGMSGARLVLTAARDLSRQSGQYALCTMCIGVGQGIALALQAV